MNRLDAPFQLVTRNTCVMKSYMARHGIKMFPRSGLSGFYRRMMTRRIHDPFENPGSFLNTNAHLAITLVSLLIAEESGWTPAIEKKFEETHEWFNQETRGRTYKWKFPKR